MKFKLPLIQTPKTAIGAPIALLTLLTIYSLSVVTSLPGLAVSPILEQLQAAFPAASQTQIQMLESLPSLLIIPFIIIAGKFSVNLPKRKLLLTGLSIFLLSSILYLIPVKSIGYLLFNSILLGAGAGIVIPLSTGLIADYFSAAVRTRQLGIVSAISNLSLVLATALAGYLAGISWHAAFLVYALSGISFAFAFRFKEPPLIEEPAAGEIALSKSSVKITQWPWGLMIFYFFVTLTVLTVPFNLSVLLSELKIGGAQTSGNLISIFFLSITVPGFLLTKILGKFKQQTPIYAISLLLAGTVAMMIGNLWVILAGVVMQGVGYGTLQPMIYDNTAANTKPIHITFFLALVMAMNYTAIIVYPFFQQSVSAIFNTHYSLLPFITSIGLILIVGFAYWKINKKRLILR